MTTLVSYGTNEKSVQTTAVTQAQASLAAAQTALKAAQDGRAQTVSDKADAEKELAALRAKLETTTAPSEITLLVKDITQKTIDLRRLLGQLTAHDEAVARAQADLAFAQARLTRAQAELKAATRFLDAAQADEDQRDAQKALCAAAPLSTLQSDADDVLTGTGNTLLADATVRFSTVPTPLMEVATARHKTLRAQVKAAGQALATAQTHLGNLAAADSGKTGAVVQAQIAWEQAQAAFVDFVSNAKTRYDWAVGVLTTLAGMPAGAKVLTTQEATDAADAGQLAVRTAAEAEAKGIADAQATVDQKRAALADAELDAHAKDPIATDVSGDAAVSAATTDLTAPLAALNTATGNFDTTERDTLVGWEVILPDGAWQKLADFLEAQAVLDDLRNTDPTTLISDLDTAESDYADALGDAAESARSLGYYEDAAAQRAALAQAALASAQLRYFSGVRGDAF